MSNPMEGLKCREFYQRYEDMSPDGRLRILIEDDGDVIVEVMTGCVTNNPRDFKMAAAQFCTYAGGGRSPKTRLALLALARAIVEDNADDPQKRW